MITVIATGLSNAGCAGDPYKRVYENIKYREDNFKSPGERAMAPTPNYSTYQKEREVLKQKMATEKEDSPIFSLKPELARKSDLSQN